MSEERLFILFYLLCPEMDKDMIGSEIIVRFCVRSDGYICYSY